MSLVLQTTNLDGSTSREAIERSRYAYDSPCLWRPTTKSSGLQLPGLLQRADAQRKQPAADRSYRSERFETNWSQRLFPKSQTVEHARELHHSFERLHAMGFGSRNQGATDKRCFARREPRTCSKCFLFTLWWIAPELICGAVLVGQASTRPS